MGLFCRIVESTDLEEILDFENQKMTEQIPDEVERTLAVWSSRGRREAMEHYLSLGWSFLARDEHKTSSFSSEGLITGYFLAQPLVFFEGHTQSLWIEHLQFSSLEARDALCELAIKLCREKHFQRVLFPSQNSLKNSLSGMKTESWQPESIWIKTTK